MNECSEIYFYIFSQPKQSVDTSDKKVKNSLFNFNSLINFLKEFMECLSIMECPCNINYVCIRAHEVNKGVYLVKGSHTGVYFIVLSNKWHQEVSFGIK